MESAKGAIESNWVTRFYLTRGSGRLGAIYFRFGSDLFSFLRVPVGFRLSFDSSESGWGWHYFSKECAKYFFIWKIYIQKKSLHNRYFGKQTLPIYRKILHFLIFTYSYTLNSETQLIYAHVTYALTVCMHMLHKLSQIRYICLCVNQK